MEAVLLWLLILGPGIGAFFGALIGDYIRSRLGK